MKRTKYTAFIITVALFINCFPIVAIAEEQPMSASDFSTLIQQFASDYAPGGIVTSNNSDKSLNRLIVKTSTNKPLDNYYGAIAKLEGYEGFHILQFETKAQTRSALANLQTDNIEYVEYDTWLGIEGSAGGWCSCSDNPSIKGTCECCSGEQGMCNCKDIRAQNGHLSWNSSAVHIDEAFDLIKNLQIDCKDVKVAVFDTGLYVEHKRFHPNRIDLDENYHLLIDGVEYETDEDGHYHGTHIAGTIYDNTMENVKICPYRVYGDEDFELIPYIVFWSALNAAIETNVDVINISSIQRKFTSEEEEKHNKEESFSELLEKAENKNIVIVTGAGNRKREITNTDFPAAYPKAITVSATTIDNVPDKSYSNYGEYVDVGAPGTDIYSTTPWVPLKGDYNKNEINVSYIRDSGTSYAAPLVAAAAATLKSISPDLTPEEIKRIIKETAYTPENWDNRYGVGIVDFYEMVKYVVREKPEILLNSDDKFEIFPAGGAATTYYTLDGSEPTPENGLLYSSPLDLSNKTVSFLKAASYKNGEKIGETVTHKMYRYETIKMNYKETKHPISSTYTKRINWQSSDPNIATVDSDGNIKAVGIGETQVTAKFGSGKRVIYNVKVEYSKLQWFIMYFLLGFLWY